MCSDLWPPRGYPPFLICPDNVQAGEEEARQRFQRRVAQLHHLLSTAARPGIFAAPFLPPLPGAAPAYGGLPLEDHVRKSMRLQVCLSVTLGLDWDILVLPHAATDQVCPCPSRMPRRVLLCTCRQPHAMKCRG